MAYKHIALRFISVLVIYIYLASSYVAATEHIEGHMQDADGIQESSPHMNAASKLIASVGHTIYIRNEDSLVALQKTADGSLAARVNLCMASNYGAVVSLVARDNTRNDALALYHIDDNNSMTAFTATLSNIRLSQQVSLGRTNAPISLGYGICDEEANYSIEVKVLASSVARLAAGQYMGALNVTITPQPESSLLNKVEYKQDIQEHQANKLTTTYTKLSEMITRAKAQLETIQQQTAISTVKHEQLLEMIASSQAALDKIQPANALVSSANTGLLHKQSKVVQHFIDFPACIVESLPVIIILISVILLLLFFLTRLMRQTHAFRRRV
jgi:hypothetical protein